jgi:NAD+ synthase (glutamine-hydrolysing)
MNKHGFIRLTCLSPEVHIANPKANKAVIKAALNEHQLSDIILFPELSLTAYTCGDLFNHDLLLENAKCCLLELAQQVGRQLVFLGLPLKVDNGLYNCGAVLNQGRIIGIFPKQFLPNYSEFYEARWFKGADGNEPKTVRLGGQEIPFGIDLLFKYQGTCSVIVSASICEDDWMPISPSSFQALAGATVQCNLSASNEIIGKHQYRLNTVILGQSGRHISACAYASAGASESTTDLVFGGHMAIAENGSLLANSHRIGGGLDYDNKGDAISADIDVSSLLNERQRMNSFTDCSKRYAFYEMRYLSFELSTNNSEQKLLHKITGTPFVPQQKLALESRCAEIFGIQSAGLKKRLQQLGDDPHIWIGISGGLDSTLAALVALKTFDALGLPHSNLHGLTMPGFGTSILTKGNADRFMQLTNISIHEEDICQLALDTFKTQKHRSFGIIDPCCSLIEFKHALSVLTKKQRLAGDLVFENVQARLRTFLLMSHGFVLGTGDLSEMALGWCTYNADHMSMYNVNCSIPKTLVSWLVRYVAEHEYQGGLREVLMSIAATPISPELLPLSPDGTMSQLTEESLGAYELHDFFIYHMLRKAHTPEKIIYLAAQAKFNQNYSSEQIKQTLKLFYRRFFSQQYKRSCVPDGPKVGSVSLSPRGDWRMPSDAEADLWLRDGV